jgi:hypothetical protein
MGYLVIYAFLYLLMVGCWMAIYSKAGYRWWVGLFALIPGVTGIMFLHISLATWPVVRMAEDGVVWAGTASEKEIVPFLGRAGALARKGDPGAGVAMCRFVMDKYAGTPAARDAEIVMGEIMALPT